MNDYMKRIDALNAIIFDLREARMRAGDAELKLRNILPFPDSFVNEKDETEKMIRGYVEKIMQMEEELYTIAERLDGSRREKILKYMEQHSKPGKKYIPVVDLER